MPNPLPQNALIGMVHVGAIPGSPAHDGRTVDQLVAQARAEACVLAESGFDAVIVENMHDTPYLHGDALGPETVACMTRVAQAVQDAAGVLLGVQILSGGNRHAFAVAHAAGAGFIRCENFAYAHVADEGLLPTAEAPALLRYRKSIGAESIAVFCDIKKKHASHAITGDLSIEDAAKGAAFFGADGLIVTGGSTGEPADPDDVRRTAGASGLPVLVGSGVDESNAKALLEHADALIVGSSIKSGGRWTEPVDPARAAAFVRAARG